MDRNSIEKKKVLFASPEVMPFGGTGGLGEVAGSLPGAVNHMEDSEIECRVIMPLYDTVKPELPGTASTWESSNLRRTA